MAKLSQIISLFLTISLMFNVSFSQFDRQESRSQQQQHRLRAKTQCNIQRLNADEPSRRFESEAGVTEFWEANNRQEFECAGVEVERRQIQSRGLVLPSYSNTHKLMYVVQGNGIHGAVIPGCAETYESQPGRSSAARGEQQQERQRSSDRNQKLRRISEGDIVALPAGITHWFYNDGEETLVTVSLIDVASEDNQLDLNHMKFFLAGKPRRGQQQSQHRREERQHRGQQEQEHEQESEQSQRQREERQHRGQEEEQEREREQGEHEQGERKNIFNGFDDEILADAFNVDTEIIRQLNGQDDQRGTIVKAERLELALPEYQQEEQQRGSRRGHNGIEETLCSAKLRENIGHASRADLFNPRAGRIGTANSQTLPILRQLQLSAERGTLYSNAIVAPQWTVNAHSAIYAIRGNARIQVVGSNGNSVFDEEVRQGQILIVPQNFAVVQKAGDQGFEYISFKTNDNAMTSPIAGRLSTFRALPEEVLMNAYRINKEQARSLKYNRQEATLFSSQGRSDRREE